MSDKQIDFYFDFSSPYGYLAAELIEGLAERVGAEVTWRPFLLGAVFKEIGTQPLLDIPMKGPYAKCDIPREARYHGLAFVFPQSFPFSSVAAARAFFWVSAQDSAKAKQLAQALYRRAFAQGQEITSPHAVVEVGVSLGLDEAELTAALQDPAVKDRLRKEVEAAREVGVFGSPYFVYAGEPFWGVDHMVRLEEWITRGGW